VFTTQNHRFSRLHTTAAFQTATECNFQLGSAELFPTINPSLQLLKIKFIGLIIYDEWSLLPFIWKSLFWPSSSRYRPKIVMSLMCCAAPTVWTCRINHHEGNLFWLCGAGKRVVLAVVHKQQIYLVKQAFNNITELDTEAQNSMIIITIFFGFILL
jgi:hypothetical protein